MSQVNLQGNNFGGFRFSRQTNTQDEVTRNEKNLDWTNNGFLLFQLNKLQKLIVTYGDYSQRCKPMVVVAFVCHTVTVFCCFVCEQVLNCLTGQYCRSAEIFLRHSFIWSKSFVAFLIVCVFCVCVFRIRKVSKQRVHKSIVLAAIPNLYFRFNVSAVRVCSPQCNEQ